VSAVVALGLGNAAGRITTNCTSSYVQDNTNDRRVSNGKCRCETMKSGSALYKKNTKVDDILQDIVKCGDEVQTLVGDFRVLAFHLFILIHPNGWLLNCSKNNRAIPLLDIYHVTEPTPHHCPPRLPTSNNNNN